MRVSEGWGSQALGSLSAHVSDVGEHSESLKRSLGEGSVLENGGAEAKVRMTVSGELVGVGRMGSRLPTLRGAGVR